ncbi:hypothetical protein VTN02DRAFT_3210 [Thermoascus thermophilus]
MNEQGQNQNENENPNQNPKLKLSRQLSTNICSHPHNNTTEEQRVQLFQLSILSSPLPSLPKKNPQRRITKK